MKSKLLNYKNKNLHARFTDIFERKGNEEITITIEIDPDYKSGEKFDQVLASVRNKATEIFRSAFREQNSPTINIIVRDKGQPVHIDSAGTGDPVAIALNLPLSKYAMVNFSAEWCEKGHAIDKAWSELADKFQDQVFYLVLDTDEETGLTEFAGVTEVPTVMLFDPDGNKLGVYEGFMSRNQMENVLAKHIK